MTDNQFGGFAPEMIPTGFVGEIKNSRGQAFRVFGTADSAYLLFSPLDRYGCELCLQFPVRIDDLTDAARVALFGGH